MIFVLSILLTMFSLQGMELKQISPTPIKALDAFRQIAVTYAERRNEALLSFDVAPSVMNEAAKNILGIVADHGWENDHWRDLKQFHKPDYDEWVNFFLQHFSPGNKIQEMDIVAQNSKDVLLFLEEKSQEVHKQENGKVTIACVNLFSGFALAALATGIYIFKLASLSCV